MFRGRVYSEQNAKEVLHLVDLSLFRAVPHFLKRFVYNDQKWFTIQLATKLVPTALKQSISNDNQFEANVFVRDALARLEVVESKATLKYYHLKGAHRPLSVDRELTFTDEIIPFNRENYIVSIKANIRSLGQFLERLKIEGIFDRSLILIAGDHGSGNSPDVYIGQRENVPTNDVNKRNFKRDKARGVPLFLVKRIGASGPIALSDAPVSLMDIPATVLAEMDIDSPSAGRSVFEIGPGQSRARTYGAFDYSANRSDYIGPLTIYEVNGNSWLDSSWSVKRVALPGVSDSHVRN